MWSFIREAPILRLEPPRRVCVFFFSLLASPNLVLRTNCLAPTAIPNCGCSTTSPFHPCRRRGLEGPDRTPGVLVGLPWFVLCSPPYFRPHKILITYFCWGFDVAVYYVDHLFIWCFFITHTPYFIIIGASCLCKCCWGQAGFISHGDTASMKTT